MIIDRFKLYPYRYNPHLSATSHYYHVWVFDNKKQMWEMSAKLTNKDEHLKGGFGAIVIPYLRYKPSSQEYAPKIGDVLFHKDCLGSECISHEAVHMSTNYLRIIDRLKLSDQIDDHEETLAYSIGGCTRQIVDRLYKQKIL